MNKLIVCIFAATLIVGCAEDGESIPDAMAQDGAPMPMDDASTPDARPDGSPPPMMMDASVPDAAVPGTEAASYSAAQVAASSASCPCNYMEREYESEMACRDGVAASAPSADVLMCQQGAIEAAAPGAVAFFACYQAALEALTTCVNASACDMAALGLCDAAYERTTDGCPSATMAEQDAYSTSYEECIVGMAGSAACPEEMTNMTGASVFSGSTFRAGDDVTPSADCVDDSSSPDRSFEWTAAAAGDYVIDTVGSAFDTVLVVRDGCSATAAEIACNDDVEGETGPGAGTLQSSVTVTATAGQAFIITVDAYSTGAGEFVVNINPAM